MQRPGQREANDFRSARTFLTRPNRMDGHRDQSIWDGKQTCKPELVVKAAHTRLRLSHHNPGDSRNGLAFLLLPVR